MRHNSTFHGSEPAWANACVGNNGSPSYVEYAKGYSAAANLMLNEVIAGEGITHPVDTFIYPICFNMRHSIELRLKGTVTSLKEVAEIQRKKLHFDLVSSHDIGNIWNFIKEHSSLQDKRYQSIISRLDKYIQDFAAIDSTGQTFRYPHDRNKSKHLTNVSVINICHLKLIFCELESLLDALHDFNTFLQEEYSKGTFTRNLSRAELFSLASDIPPEHTWLDTDFNRVRRRELQIKYGISSNEMAKAIWEIKHNYEMGSLISAIPELKGVKFEDLCVFFDQWVKLHGTERLKPAVGKVKNMNLRDVFDLEVNSDRRRVKAECCDELLKLLNVESIAGLKALFYSASYKLYSEDYEIIYEEQARELAFSYDKCPGDYKVAVLHLLNKTNAFDCILMSLYFLGYADFSEQLIKKYELGGCFHWQSKALSRELFKKPEIYGYTSKN